MSSPFFVKLEDRGAVTVTGPDRRLFLQGLITNDVNLLDTQPCVYSCLLTPQGKFLFDFFMTEQGDTIQLECEGNARAHMLLTRLNHFKLRSKITIECIDNTNVFQIISTAARDASALPDPRLPALGFRTYTRPDDIPEYSFDEWDTHRILLTVPDGSRDLQVEKSTLEDGHIDRLNGVSYTKGCYMGQELTARIHHRGLAKRHLLTIRTANGAPLPQPGAEMCSGGTVLGEMRSSCRDAGLALIKDESVPLLAAAGYKTVGI